MQINLDLNIDKFKNYLKNVKKILLVNHRRMDTDAYGSLTGFYFILEKIGNYELICLSDEKTPEYLKFLNQNELFKDNIVLNNFNPDLIISFDVASIEQLGEIYKKNIKVFTNTTWVNIDHHISNSLFGNINIVDINSSSTCEIIWDIIKKIDFEKYMDKNIATLLLAGIIADTNSFLNSNFSVKSLKSASELMKYNPRHQDIVINLFKKKSYNKIKLWGKILESLKDIKDGKIIWNTIPKSLFIQTQTTDKDISGLIDEFLVTIDGMEVGFLLYELDDKKIKGSFRTKNDKINLDSFCSKWGGGGHSKASGFIIEGKNLYEIEQEIIEELKKIV